MKGLRDNMWCLKIRAACSRLRSNSRVLLPSTMGTDDVQVSVQVDAFRKLPVLNVSWIRGQAKSATIYLQNFWKFDTPIQYSQGWRTHPPMQWIRRNFWPGVKRPGHKLTVYLLTPWSRVLLEKLASLQLVKQLPAFYGTRRFLTALTSARHLSLSWASPIQSSYPNPTPWSSILILSSHLRLGLPSGSHFFNFT